MTLKRRAGSILWMASLQYFIMQPLVAYRWTNGFSLRHNTISDLGNTACSIYDGRYVCSPLHNLMNLSFIFLGITQFLGALYFYKAPKQTKAVQLGMAALALAGVGTLTVGLFPENSVSWIHGLGAAMPFLIGNIGLVVLGLSLKLPNLLRLYTVFSGLIALVALGLFVSHIYLGLGSGGIERLTAYPQTIWLIVFGTYYLTLRKPHGVIFTD